MHDNSANPSALTSWPKRLRVEQVLDHFEAAWKLAIERAAAAPIIEEFLGDSRRSGENPNQTMLMFELVALDVAYRLRRNESPQVDDYASRFPGLDRDRLAGLITRASTTSHGRSGDQTDPDGAMPQCVHDSTQSTANETPDSVECPAKRSARVAPLTNVRCPHCRSPIQLADKRMDEVLCPSCGSSVRVCDTPLASTVAHLRQVGEFQLIERLGLGGFGTVWKARDTVLDKVVALKIPHAHYLESPAERERFFREARAAANLRHPSIVAVHHVVELETDSGKTPVIVSDFVEGITLHELLEHRRLTFREAGALIAQVADALDHAHERGVVHRDLKPANIMIEFPAGLGLSAPLDCDSVLQRSASSATRRSTHDSRSDLYVPRSSGRPRPMLVDFGLALRDDVEATMTVDGQLLGTPFYMSPEQASGRGHHVDGRSDVWSLGVILYFLIAGEYPFRGSRQAVVLQIQNEEPRPPGKLNDRIPRDLETITLKCLAKQRGQRYQSAAELAGDLKRWLEGEPIRARPIGFLEKAWRWCRRRPAVAALVAVAAASAVFVATTGIVSYHAVRDQLHESLYQQARASWLAGEHGWRDRTLEAVRNAAAIRPTPELRDVAIQAIVGSDCLKAEFQPFSEFTSVNVMAASSDGREFAIAVRSTVHRLDLRSERRLGDQFDVGHDEITVLRYSADGRRLACGGRAGTIELWDLPAHALPSLSKRLAKHRGSVRAIAFGPGPNALSSTDGKEVAIWNIDDGGELSRVALEPAPFARFKPVDDLPIVDTAPMRGRRSKNEDRSFASAVRADYADSVQFGRRESVVAVAAGLGIAFSLNGSSQPPAADAGDQAFPRASIVAGRNFVIAVRDGASPVRWAFEETKLEPGHAIYLPSGSNPLLALTANEQFLIYAYNDLDATTMNDMMSVPSAAPAPASKPVPSPEPAASTPTRDCMPVDQEGRVKSNEASPDQPPPEPPAQPPTQPLQPPPLAASAAGGTTIRSLPGPDLAVGASSTGLATTNGRRATDCTVQLYSLDRSDSTQVELTDAGKLRSIALSVDSKQIVLAGEDGFVNVLELNSNELRLAGSFRAVARDLVGLVSSPDGKTLIAAARNLPLTLWQMRRPDCVAVLAPGGARSLAKFSPDGSLVAVADRLGGVVIRDTSTGAVIARHSADRVFQLAWSSAGNVLHYAEPSEGLHRMEWPDPETARADSARSDPIRLVGDFPPMQISSLALSPDSSNVVLGRCEASALVCQASTHGLTMQASIGQSDQSTHALAFASGAPVLVSAGATTVRTWNAQGWSLRGTLETQGRVFALAVSADGRLVASGSERGQICVWDGVSIEPMIKVSAGDEVCCVTLSADNRQLASGQLDGSVTLWELPSGRRLASWVAHPRGVAAMAFAPNRPALLTCGFDGTFVTWHTDRIRSELRDMGLDW